MSKRAAEAALQLLGIFLLFSMTYILQPDNGSEFTAEVIHATHSSWEGPPSSLLEIRKEI